MRLLGFLRHAQRWAGAGELSGPRRGGHVPVFVLIAAVALMGAAAGCVGGAHRQAAAARAEATAPAVSPSPTTTGVQATPGTQSQRPSAASTTSPATTPATVTSTAAPTGPPGTTIARAPTGSVPAAVVAVARSSGGSGEVAVDWNAVPGATGYRVLRTNTAGAHARVVADFTITTGHTTAAQEVVNIWSADHSYLPDRGRLTRVDQSPWFQYIDIGEGRRCYRVLAYNPTGDGPPSAVTCGSPPGE